MTRRELCHCGHDRATHHKEYRSSGHDVNQVREPLWGACLGALCDCMYYMRKDED